MTTTSAAATAAAGASPTGMSELDQRLLAAVDRLLHGRSQITDGVLNVTNICAEAGVSRASFYRSPAAHAIKQLLAEPATPRPEIEQLRQQNADLRRTERQLRATQAAEIRAHRASIAVYANQIQILALANAELQAENQRLRGHNRVHGTVTPLHR